MEERCRNGTEPVRELLSPVLEGRARLKRLHTRQSVERGYL